MQCWGSFFTGKAQSVAHFGLRSGGFSIHDQVWIKFWYQQIVPGDRSRTSEVLDADISPCDELVMHSGVYTHADGIGYTTATSQKPGSVIVQVKIVALAIHYMFFYLYHHVLCIKQNSVIYRF